MPIPMSNGWPRIVSLIECLLNQWSNPQIISLDKPGRCDRIMTRTIQINYARKICMKLATATSSVAPNSKVLTPIRCHQLHGWWIKSVASHQTPHDNKSSAQVQWMCNKNAEIHLRTNVVGGVPAINMVRPRMRKSRPRVRLDCCVWGVLPIIVAVLLVFWHDVHASEFPERECCDPIYPPMPVDPEPVPPPAVQPTATTSSSSQATPFGQSGMQCEWSERSKSLQRIEVVCSNSERGFDLGLVNSLFPTLRVEVGPQFVCWFYQIASDV